MANLTANTGKCLGQARPADTTAVSIYSPGDGIKTELQTIIVSNTTAGALTYRIFHDEDGITYDQSTALFYDVSLAANSTDTIEVTLWMVNTNGSFAVRTSSASGLTFTVYGIEHKRFIKQVATNEPNRLT